MAAAQLVSAAVKVDTSPEKLLPADIAPSSPRIATTASPSRPTFRNASAAPGASPGRVEHMHGAAVQPMPQSLSLAQHPPDAIAASVQSRSRQAPACNDAKIATAARSTVSSIGGDWEMHLATLLPAERRTPGSQCADTQSHDRPKKPEAETLPDEQPIQGGGLRRVVVLGPPSEQCATEPSPSSEPWAGLTMSPSVAEDGSQRTLNGTPQLAEVMSPGSELNGSAAAQLYGDEFTGAPYAESLLEALAWLPCTLRWTVCRPVYNQVTMEHNRRPNCD